MSCAEEVCEQMITAVSRESTMHDLDAAHIEQRGSTMDFHGKAFLVCPCSSGVVGRRLVVLELFGTPRNEFQG